MDLDIVSDHVGRREYDAATIGNSNLRPTYDVAPPAVLDVRGGLAAGTWDVCAEIAAMQSTHAVDPFAADFLQSTEKCWVALAPWKLSVGVKPTNVDGILPGCKRVLRAVLEVRHPTDLQAAQSQSP